MSQDFLAILYTRTQSQYRMITLAENRRLEETDRNHDDTEVYHRSEKISLQNLWKKRVKSHIGLSMTSKNLYI